MTKDTMLKELSEFFKDKDKSMDVSTYCANALKPYSKQQIGKVFKSYKKMMIELRALPEPKKVVPPVKVNAKVAVADAVELSKESGK